MQHRVEMLQMFWNQRILFIVAFRCSASTETKNSVTPNVEILKFIRSVSSELQGTHHQWLNCSDQIEALFHQNGIFLVLVDSYTGHSNALDQQKYLCMFEKVKLLQQRFPKLNIVNLLHGDSVKFASMKKHAVQTIIEQLCTFPLLLSNKSFSMMTNGPCYLLFDDSRHHLLYNGPDIDLKDIGKVIEESDAAQEHKTNLFDNLDAYKAKEHEVIKEPSACYSFRNLLLYYPGCVSADEDGSRLFISDINHHRVIVTDGNGKIIDCIGSSPGFEDGEFELAKLFRPAASFYSDADDCLYIADSENNAIRKADLENRTLETMFPVSAPKTSGVWNWILSKFGLAGESDVNPKSEESDVDSFSLPWHLLELGADSLLVINRSFEKSWIISMKSWEITSVTEGHQNIVDNYGEIVKQKVAPLQNIYENSESCCVHSLDGIPHAELTSSVAIFQSYTILCDAAGNRVLKCHRESKDISHVQFSDLRVLGFPYWLISPLERVFKSGQSSRTEDEHIHRFSVLPGKCNMRVFIEIPKDTELAAPLEQDCIWRQARGSIADIYESSSSATSPDKVGVAQQWFDELDNLAFSKANNELRAEVDDGQATNFQDTSKVQFDCPVNISPGTGEVVISVALYLKLNKTECTNERSVEAKRILNLNQESISHEEETCVELLTETGGDLKQHVFVKPVNLRIRLDCSDYPTATTKNETILTDTPLEVNISLD